MIILASASPRRKELLSLAGIEYTVIPSECDEALPEKISPPEAVTLLAERKADDVFKRYPGDIIIAADTVVALGEEILGKPKNETDAFKMLRMLSGKMHTVYTGVCIMNKDGKDIFFCSTEVEFYELTDDEITEYISTGEPTDKAGAYGIQGKGALLVKRISGDYLNVVGLPLSETVRKLRACLHKPDTRLFGKFSL